MAEVKIRRCGIKSCFNPQRTTLKHIFRKTETVGYPEQRLPLAPRYRGRHILIKDEDGLERCVGCELCAVACTADAIYIRGASLVDDLIGKLTFTEMMYFQLLGVKPTPAGTAARMRSRS